MLHLVGNNLLLTIFHHFTYMEMLSKEVALLEDSIEYLQNGYGTQLKDKCRNTKDASEIIVYDNSKVKLLETLSSRDVILFELMQE